MVALPQQFNTADLPDTGGNSVLIPPGQYQALIVESELKATSKGDGQMLVLKVVLTQGQYANTEFTERLNIINPNPKAVEIAYKTLARISEAVGMTQTPADSTHLHNKPFMVTIETEPGSPWTDKDNVQREGKDKSIIKGYKPLGAVTAQAPAAAPFGAPPAAAAAPVGTPPWAAKK
jgi:hypothetical protein